MGSGKGPVALQKKKVARKEGGKKDKREKKGEQKITRKIGVESVVTSIIHVQRLTLKWAMEQEKATKKRRL